MNFGCVVDTTRADDLVDEKLRVRDLQCVGATRLHPSHPQNRILDRDGCRGTPLHVRELTQTDEVDLGLEGGLARERLADQVHQQRDVGGGDRVRAWAKGVQRPAVAEENRRLAIADDNL